MTTSPSPTTAVRATAAEKLDEEQREAFKGLLRLHLRFNCVRTEERLEYTYKQVRDVIAAAKEIYKGGNALAEINPPCIIVGDIHGQFRDLQRMFAMLGEDGSKKSEKPKPGEKDKKSPIVRGVTRNKFLFLGDYVDRGMNSTECMVTVLLLKIIYGNKIVLLRGNHECRAINRIYGFFQELEGRFSKTEANQLYEDFNDLFDMMPVAGLVGRKILCMHGGLSPNLNKIDDIRKIPMPITDPPAVPLAMDLMWADPVVGLKGFKPNTLRGVSVFFGEDAVAHFCKESGVELIVRAHQVMQNGFGFYANRKLVTIFTAPRYFVEKNNKGAVLDVREDSTLGFKILVPPSRDYGPETNQTFARSFDDENQRTSYVTVAKMPRTRA